MIISCGDLLISIDDDVYKLQLFLLKGNHIENWVSKMPPDSTESSADVELREPKGNMSIKDVENQLLESKFCLQLQQFLKVSPE